jgi:cytochrome c5
MKHIQYFAIVLIVIVIILSAGCGETPTPSATATPEVDQGQKLVASRCTVCHTLGTVESKQSDREGWQAVVERMVLKGASLNATEQELVIDYLALNFPK